MNVQSLTHKPIDPDVLAVVEEYHHQPEAILEIIQALQKKPDGLSEMVLQDVAQALNIPLHKAYGIATFYSMVSFGSPPAAEISICDGVACWLQGSLDWLDAAPDELGSEWAVKRSSCLGLCDRAPAALVDDQPCGPLDPQTLTQVASGWRGPQPNYLQPLPGELRLLLAGIEKIDPKSLDSARGQGAYEALEAALKVSPADIIKQVIRSGIRGRGGAGFPAGTKWQYVAASDRVPRYIVCNADESEPLVFKDRVLMETNPHQLLEGMALAGYAVGAREGFIYIRGEYEPQAVLLEHAIHQAETAGWLGDQILGTDFSFHIHLHRGAGAYICGEETALLESLEGRRGEPRLRPPYPTVSGYKGKPTVVNNVETLAAVPAIIRNGGEWYRAIGNPEYPGTKLYTLLGHIQKPSLFEAPYGLTLREIIDRFGGGVATGSEFQFALIGGAAGTIVPSDFLDVPITYDTTPQGISLGAGAILVCDQTVSPVALVRELMHFFEVESCGKCTPCRIGTRTVRGILDRMLSGQGHPDDLADLTRLADVLERDSFCGLGIFAAMPLTSSLAHFETEYRALCE